EWIHGTINGMGERAGNASIGEVAMALTALYGIETGLRLDRIREVSAMVRDLGGYELEPWKAVGGENLFGRESGAVAAQVHDPPGDRAVLLCARGRGATNRARQEERPRLDPDQGGRARPGRA